MSWNRVSDPEQRGVLISAAVGRVYAARSAAERRDIPVPELDSGEIWQTDDGTVTVWTIPGDGEVVLADVDGPTIAWPILDDLAAQAGWSGIWHFSSFAEGTEMAALAAAGDARRVATKMRVSVSEVPAPAGIRLVPMGEDDFAAYRAVADEDYAQERFASGAEPTIEDSRRVAAEQMAELLPDGPRTPGHRLWTVRDSVGERVGILWVHVGEDAAFIYDISLDESRRGQGLGTQALRAAAEQTAAAGLDVLALNVFGSNDGARRLYAREGYRETEALWSVPIGRHSRTVSADRP
ncbi:GNAT family N-acetyltransferase [Microbacterium bovistercoris]|uniref:GNAT family N-acetyltransferase n=1 Tax=Microbacterium bovistercoris TaxID=2293570 RepID=A0A371NUP0_9MICO|nr:GNAT family N-acetyltransferase [Microbacterium bovistercoris]REJ05509.1 GNAT family N-acetyltransferase [Microbacterium bovistercoris]